MSRSRRHTPVMGNTCSKSEKKDKQLAHRKFRAMEREAMGAEVMPIVGEGSNRWRFAKDGKSRFDPIEEKKWMRK